MMNRKMMVNREAERPMAEVRARRGGMGPVRARPLPETEPVYKKGGSVKKSKESKEMAKKEISFMKKKGAPKSMIKHEKAEYGMKKGGSVGGSFRRAADGVASKGKTKGKIIKMRYGGEC